MENQVISEPTSPATPPLVTDSATPIVPTNPKPSNHKPIIIFILILFLLSLSAITYLYFQNQALKQEANSLPLNKGELEGVESKSTTSPDLTSDLLTYTNLTHNIAFQYPADHTLTTSLDDLVVLTNGRIQINLKANVTASSINSEIEAIQTAVANNDLTAQVRTLGERQVFIDSRMSTEGTFTTTAHIEHQNTQYLTLTLEADTALPGNEEPAIYRELESLLDQILSTFKFLDQ